ncbi:MAG: hypothetical protein J6Y28_09905 [Acholeplasmatales bacterium]|nr:hypothetical protein [Methanobrevibacter sp.]MBP5446473.1 hypothetical protein [Acholeplasmatales bacterium]
MKTADALFENAISNWRSNLCVGSCIIPSPLNDKIIILGILQRIYNKSPNVKITIYVNTFSERINLIEFLTKQENEENNNQFKQLLNNKHIVILSIDYLERNGSSMSPYVCIVYHCERIEKHLEEQLIRSKFKLVVLNKLMPTEDMAKLYSVCPLLDSFKQAEIDEVRLSTPVRERWIGVTIPEDTEEYKLLKYYDEYITTSISIFGGLSAIDEAREGNAALNISSNQICYKIATDNGWNPHLDMSVEINVQLDELYNPISLKERASQTYEMIRNRSKLLSDYEGKLEEILKIVENNKDKKILIINKRGEFANKVTDYINKYSETIICGNYHDKVEAIPAVDINGNPIYYKSGTKKGERKYMYAQAQKTQNEELFNMGKLKILSTNNAPDKTLSVDVDVIIITSPQCDNIKNYMYRLSNVYYPNNVINLYSIFVKNSIEETKIQNKDVKNNHEIINKNDIFTINENNSDFIIVD